MTMGKFGAWALAAALAAGFSGADRAAAQTASGQAVLESYDATTPLTRFDGGAVTLGDLIHERRQFDAQLRDMADEEAYARLLGRVERRKLLAESARRAGVAEAPAVALAIAAATEQALMDAYLASQGGATPTDAEIESTYADIAATMPVVETRARHILVETEAEAAAIKAEVDGGADFGAVAAEKSTDPGRGDGGDLGWARPGQFVPAFEAAMAVLQPGEVSGPVQTQFGWHIIKVEERRDGTLAPPLDQVRDQVAFMVLERKADEAAEAARAALNAAPSEARPPYEAVRRDDLIGR